MRRFAATALGLGISVGVLAMMCIQRWVATIDDAERRRSPRIDLKEAKAWAREPFV